MSNPSRLFLLLALVLGACGRGDADSASEAAAAAAAAPPTTLEQAAQQAAEAISQRGGGAEPVDAARLQAHLPESVAGLARVDMSRESTGAMGMKMSMAQARYEDGDRSISISINDMGGLGGIGMMGAAAWAMSDFDRTTQDGFERTTRFEGFKAMESQKVDGDYRHAELNILVADRFMVQMEGNSVDLDALKDAARALDLRGLAREK